MKTDFDKAREWRCAQKVSAIILIAISLINIAREFSRASVLSESLVATLAVAVTGWGVWKNSRCPYCRKSIMSAWTGRDGGKRNCVQRIEKRQSVVCIHCGEEIDTDN